MAGPLSTDASRIEIEMRNLLAALEDLTTALYNVRVVLEAIETKMGAGLPGSLDNNGRLKTSVGGPV